MANSNADVSGTHPSLIVEAESSGSPRPGDRVFAWVERHNGEVADGAGWEGVLTETDTGRLVILLDNYANETDSGHEYALVDFPRVVCRGGLNVGIPGRLTSSHGTASEDDADRHARVLHLEQTFRSIWRLELGTGRHASMPLPPRPVPGTAERRATTPRVITVSPEPLFHAEAAAYLDTLDHPVEVLPVSSPGEMFEISRIQDVALLLCHRGESGMWLTAAAGIEAGLRCPFLGCWTHDLHLEAQENTEFVPSMCCCSPERPSGAVLRERIEHILALHLGLQTSAPAPNPAPETVRPKRTEEENLAQPVTALVTRPWEM